MEVNQILTSPFAQVCTVLDVMGEASAAAQNLKNPITSGAKMMAAEVMMMMMMMMIDDDDDDEYP